MTVVVSDTSPIVCLSHLQLPGLLPKLFGTILVPPAVVDELRAGRDPDGVLRFVAECLEVRPPKDRSKVQQLSARLHAGEAEALALALEVKPDAVLIDERTGRAVARELGLRPLGVLGVFVRAKKKGLVPSVRPLLTRLVDDFDFRISSRVRRDVLELSGESDADEPPEN